MVSHEYIVDLIHSYGVWAVFLVVGLESIGIPLPGELVLILASSFAATHGGSLLPIIIAASAGAILGDNIGYMLGREFGYRLLLRFGYRLGISEAHLKLGRFLFAKYGALVVFLGRFVAVLRVLAAFLAGTNRLPWGTFLIANAAGAVLWSTVVATLAYSFGQSFQHLTKSGSIILLVAGAVAAFVVWRYFRKNELDLIDTAEKSYPGPIPGYRTSV